MATYTIEITAFGLYTNDAPEFEIWAEGALIGTYSAGLGGTSIIETITFGGALPSSLDIRFNDASLEVGRSIEIRSFQINDRHINTNNYLSTDTLTQGQTAVVDVSDNGFLFDATEPDLTEFTTGATQTLTAGNDDIRIHTSVTNEVFDALDGRDAIYLGTGNDKVNGNNGDDLIRGNDGNDLLYGASGNDRLYGEDGDDTLYGGDGNDRAHGGNGNDEIHGNDGIDKLHGNDGDDVITGGLGNDTITGGNGQDYLFGDEGDDQISSGADNDSIDGGDGNDLAYGGAGDDIIDGGDGNDYLIGNTGDDLINGGDGDDTLLGLEDNDTIYGNDGADIIFGGIGNDNLDGGAGNDDINGGDGNDTIYGDGLTLINVAEAGQVSVSQADGNEWHSISFSSTLDNAVVKLFANDVTGDPFTTRVRNITSSGFEFQLDEYDYLDGATGLEGISWLAVSAGTHTLSTGQVIQAGFTNATNETVSSVAFDNAFGTVPVVFSQLSSDNDLSAVVTRNSGASTTGFDVYMHEQELGAGAHANEDIGWIAIEQGGSVAEGLLVGATGDNVTHNNTTINFGSAFSTAPVFIADSQTNDGADPGNVAGNGTLTTTSAVIFFDEEGSADAEINHTTENVGYIALNSGLYQAFGALNGQDIVRGGAGDDTIYADTEINAPASSISTLQEEILSNSPIAYFQLDDTGTTAVNQGSLGTAVDGTLVNGVTTGEAALYSGGGQSMRFDGVNDHITIPDNAAINLSAVDQRTIELVFNADNTTGRQVLYEEGGGVNALAIYLDGANIYFNVRDSDEFGPFTITTGIVAGETYHVAATFDSIGTGLFTGYLNGSVVGTGATATDLDAHSGDISIGVSTDGTVYHDGTTSSGNYFDGLISDVAIYNSSLSAGEIIEHAALVTGTVAGPAIAIDDVIYGGDGLDTLFGGQGRDSFVFESASAFNDIDLINNFNFTENDSIDISDLLTGYVSGVSDINDFVQISTSGSDTIISVDADGLTGGSNYLDIARIVDVTGFNVDTMLANENIIA